MSPLAKLLQIKPAAELKREDQQSLPGKIWARFVSIVRSAKVQRRVRRIEIVERITLGNKQSVVLLRLDQREFMVGCCGDSVVLLAPPPVAAVPEKAVAAKAIKTPAKQRSRVKAAKPKKVSQPVLAPTQPVASTAAFAPVVAQTNLQQNQKQTHSSSNHGLPLKRRIPTKARLVKAFAGRAQ
jgi:flagellar biogenesis protein FliO